MLGTVPPFRRKNTGSPYHRNLKWEHEFKKELDMHISGFQHLCSSCNSASARWIYILFSSPNTQIEKQLLEVILHSCEKR